MWSTCLFREDSTRRWGDWYKTAAEIIRRDLKLAGIPYTDEFGDDYDFHAPRHQFTTDLVRAGVSLNLAKELARHSKVDLTANIYTHLFVGINNKPAYTNFTDLFDNPAADAQFIWTSNLVHDNLVLMRTTVGK